MKLESDAELFEMLNEIIAAELPETLAIKDRRRSDRQLFQCQQLIAPQFTEELPSAAQFASIECHDLSPRGFAFYSAHKPTYSRLVVAFGDAPFIFVLARIKNVRSCQQGGRSMHTVGCQFIRRLS